MLSSAKRTHLGAAFNSLFFLISVSDIITVPRQRCSPPIRHLIILHNACLSHGVNVQGVAENPLRMALTNAVGRGLTSRLLIRRTRGRGRGRSRVRGRVLWTDD